MAKCIWSFTIISILGICIVTFSSQAIAAVLSASQDIILRASPPEQGYPFITGPGKDMGVIKKGEKVDVEERREIRTSLRADVWIRVKRLNPTEGPNRGWAYFGTIAKPVNFE